MTDPEAHPAAPIPETTPAEAAPPAPPPKPAPTHSPRSALAVFTGLGFLCLAAGVFYLWSQVSQLEAIDPARIASLDSQTRDLRQRLANFDQRLAALEQRPAGTADLRPLESRLAAIEQRPAPAAPAPVIADLGPLEARLAAAERIARIQAATIALDAGLPLGAIANAPPPVARFATAAPPTLATLRARYPEVARLARAASQPATATTWNARLLQGLAGLFTIRHGNEVLIGAPASFVLAAAQERLDAGDLAGAVTALDALDPAAATAAASWKADAAALLAARAALAAMAHP